MKRIILILTLLPAATVLLRSQINISSEMLSANRTYEIKAALKDSLTREPVAFASVYLHHPKDTLITDFTLSDADGKALIPKVPLGEVVFTVEMFGYKPFVKQFYLRKDVDLGEILLKVDEQQLEAAKISAAVNPIEVLQDTLVYNAAAFKTGSNASLGDLLKRMPGIEVGDNGSVTVQGKAVSRITVGGKTFFMGDNQTALNNLPAVIVNKVKIIDQDSKEAQFTGVRDTDKERVMDVELKEEYKKGWFGNARLALGASVPGSGDNEYIEKDKTLFNTNVMTSLYNDHDQLTIVAGGNNARVYGDGMLLVSRGDEELDLPRGGVNTVWQTGANLNTDRIKGLNSTGLVSYIGNDVSLRSRSDRTTYREGGDDLFTHNISDQGGTSNTLKMNFEFEKVKKDKFTFYYEPTFYLINMRRHSNENTSTTLGDELKNTSEAYSGSHLRDLEAGGRMTFGIRKLGKAKRSLTFNLNYGLQDKSGTSFDRSVTRFAATGEDETLDLNYDKDSRSSDLRGSVSYVEPLGNKWLILTSAGWGFGEDKVVSDAFNADGSPNSWYSSRTESFFRKGTGSIRLQFSKGTSSIQLGSSASATLNNVKSTSYGMSTTTGEDDWYYSLSPYISLRWIKNGYTMSVNVSGSTNTPSSGRMLPNFNFSSPTRITLGNIYLTPTTSQSANINLGKTFKKSQASFNLYSYISRTHKGIVSASWYDTDGIRYTIPVNSRKPGLVSMGQLSANLPLDKPKRLRMSMYAYFNINSNTGYQNRSTAPGIDTDAFEYSSFMESFWGDSKGSRFYSGQSGFRQSRTTYTTFAPSVGLNYRLLDALTVYLTYNPRLSSSRFSLDSSANSRLWDEVVSLRGLLTLPKEYEINTDLNHHSYHGATSQGYGSPYWDWNLSVQKSVKALSFAIDMFNILNENKSFGRTAAEDYMMDSYTNRLGRYFMLRVSYRFGKLNAAKNAAAQSTAIKMSY